VDKARPKADRRQELRFESSFVILQWEKLGTLRPASLTNTNPFYEMSSFLPFAEEKLLIFRLITKAALSLIGEGGFSAFKP
jgi:hypothetical protein